MSQLTCHMLPINCDKIHEEIPNNIHKETPDVKIFENISDSSNIPETIKFKCKMCGSNFEQKSQ